MSRYSCASQWALKHLGLTCLSGNKPSFSALENFRFSNLNLNVLWYTLFKQFERLKPNFSQTLILHTAIFSFDAIPKREGEIPSFSLWCFQTNWAECAAYHFVLWRIFFVSICPILFWPVVIRSPTLTTLPWGETSQLNFLLDELFDNPLEFASTICVEQKLDGAVNFELIWTN